MNTSTVGKAPRQAAGTRDTTPENAIGYGFAPSSLGNIFVGATARGVRALYFLDSENPYPAVARLRRCEPRGVLSADPGMVESVITRAVAHVVDGRSCDDIPLDLAGTPFQRRVWDALRLIPRGSTTTYGSLAKQLGLPPGAARAVGSACGANQVSLIVPCHRVVGAGGGLGGYYWGVDRKRGLLEIESRSLVRPA